MHIFGPSRAARAALIFSVACMYAGAVQINNKLLFAWSEFDEFRYLVFLPAGLKLMLLMLFNWRAVVGISLGVATVALTEFDGIPLASAAALGITSGLVPYLVIVGLSKALRIEYPWNGLNLKTIALISVVVGLIDALARHSMLSLLGLESFGDLVPDGALAAFGRILGTFLFLGLAIAVRNEIARASVETGR